VIHWLSPLAIAVRPSSEAPSFSCTRETGAHPLQKAFIQRFGFVHHQPMADVNTGLLQAIQTAPATCGFGSCIAATTRVTPAAISASQHGGVRP
jgi:hypothetical protein